MKFKHVTHTTPPRCEKTSHCAHEFLVKHSFLMVYQFLKCNTNKIQIGLKSYVGKNQTEGLAILETKLIVNRNG